MSSIVLFVALSIPIILISRKSIFEPTSHGFWRFLGWECMAALFAAVYRHWFDDPLSARQLASWLFLCLSLAVALAGTIVLVREGKPSKHRDDHRLMEFEKTSQLVTKGLYRYIRHPLYSSLILLTWGIFLKNPGLLPAVFALPATFFLYKTSRADEKECIAWFGDSYSEYMKTTKMFIPYIF